jgi:diguanylate cyclase (GGDEF)-like protein
MSPSIRGGEIEDAKPHAVQAVALLVRAVGEIVTRRGAFADLWPLCVDPLLRLAGATRVSLVTFDAAGGAATVASSAGEDMTLRVREAARIGAILPIDESLVIPLRYETKTIGGIVFEGVAAAADDARIAFLESCSHAIAARINYETAQHAADRFAHLAFVDALTGIANRRRFDETLRTEWARAMREKAWLSVLVADIDFFKAYNDGYGHQAGDACLHEVASILNSCVQRPSDLLARYGGEEFVALLPHTDLAGGIALGERFRAALAEHAFAHGGSSRGYVSLSVGVAARIPSADASPEVLIRAADAALYEAKNAGRDRVWAPGYAVEREGIYPRRPSVPNNVPLPATRLVGRVAEVAETLALLHDHRLVTIAGSGGGGKTRVAVHVAIEAMVRHTDGVWFVDLASIAEESLVVPAIGSAMGIAAGDDDLDAIVRAIGAKSILVVLDHCDHVSAAVAAAVRRITTDCPEARVIATSDDALDVAGEAVYRLLPFRLPDARSVPTAVEAAAFDGIQLFIERARAIEPSFTLSDTTAPVIAVICRRADGIALGIELIAARVDTGLELLARRIAERVGPQRSALAAPQTLKAIVGWTVDALPLPAQTMLARLSVFAGSWAFADAGPVCGDIQGDHAEAHAALVRAALIVEQPGIPARYRMLGPIRTFARARLADAGERRTIARRHAEHLANVVSVAGAPVPYELNDVRGALGWCFGPGGDPLCGAEIVAALASYLFSIRQSEELRWTRRASFTLPDDAPKLLQARVLMRLAAARGALPNEALDAARRAVALYDTLDDPVGAIDATLALARVIGFYYPEERPRATAVAADALAQARALGEPTPIIRALATHATLLPKTMHELKRGAFEEALAIARSLDDERLICEVSVWSSENAFGMNATADALAYGMRALEHAEAVGAPDLVMTTATNLAFYACAAGDLDLAARVGRRALTLARDADAPLRVTFAVQALATVAVAQGDDERAARLLGFAEARAGVLHMPRQAGQTEDVMFRRAFETLSERMGSEAFRRAFDAGASIDLARAERDAMR